MHIPEICIIYIIEHQKRERMNMNAIEVPFSTLQQIENKCSFVQ